MGKQGRLEVKSVKELMQDMGFNTKSPTSTQMAFMRNLLKAAYNIEITPEEEEKEFAQLSLFQKAS